MAIRKPTKKQEIDVWSFLANCTDKTLVEETDNCLVHIQKHHGNSCIFKFWLNRLMMLNQEITSRERWEKITLDKQTKL